MAQVVQVQRVHTAFALNRLYKHSRHIGVACGCGLQRVHIVQGHADKALDQRAKTGLHLGVARGAERGNAAAMKGLVKHHHFGALNALVVAKLARQLECGLVGLQARRAKEHIGHARERHQLGRQRLLQGDVVVVRRVDQLRELVLQSRHQFCVVVAQGVDRNAAQRVQVLLALGIPHVATLSVRQGNRQAAIRGHHMG